jgi:hypothetical protein
VSFLVSGKAVDEFSISPTCTNRPASHRVFYTAGEKLQYTKSSGISFTIQSYCAFVYLGRDLEQLACFQLDTTVRVSN